MAAIIKADRVEGDHSAVRTETFNFTDMGAQADHYLEQVRQDAAKIITEAHQQAEALRRQAAEQGREAAKQAAEQTLYERVEQRLETLVPALREAADEIQRARQVWIKHWESNLVQLAAAIAEKVIRREIQQQPEIALQIIRESLQLAAGGGTIQLHLHPEDQATLGDRIGPLADALAGLGKVTIAPDPQTTRGGCLVRTEFGTIDQQIETQLSRITQELTT